MRDKCTALGLLALAGCFSVVTVNGKQLLEDQWASDLSTVRSRATIDLACASENVAIEVVDNFGGQMRVASHVAAKGCGKVAVYSRIDVGAGLMLNGVKAQ